jgi:dolichyl-phosphate-mannose-protein mannosyltransferase
MSSHESRSPKPPTIDGSPVSAKHLTSIVIGFVLLFGFFARAATYKAPLLDHHAWRQADTAAIARNFYREGLNPLYPQIDQRGDQPVGYVETGFELFALLVASLALLVGFTPEIGRLLSALLFVCSCLMVWRFVRYRYGEECGLVAAFLYAFGFPLMLWAERSFMNESLLVCLSIASLRSAQRYLERRRGRDLLWLILATSLVGAIKLPYLIVWAPIAGLFLEVDGSRAWRGPLLVMMLANLVVAGAWYWHAHQLATVTGLSFGMTDKLFDPAVVFSISFPQVMVSRLSKDVFGPVGIVGAAAGLWYGLREKRWCELFGVLGFVAYLVLVAGGNYIHDYYQLAVMPVTPSLVSFGLVRLVDTFRSSSERRRHLLAAALGVAALATFVRSASAHSWYEYATADVELCRSIAAVSLPDERLVMLGTSDPKLLFCVDRRGWLLPAPVDEQSLRRTWEAGGRLVVVPKSLPDGDGARRFLAEVGSTAVSTLDADVFRLTPSPGRTK